MISLKHLILLGFFLFNHFAVPEGDSSKEQSKQSPEVQKTHTPSESLRYNARPIQSHEVLEAVDLDTAIYLFEKLDSELQI